MFLSESMPLFQTYCTPLAWLLLSILLFLFFSIVFMNEFKELQIKPGKQTVTPGCWESLNSDGLFL